MTSPEGQGYRKRPTNIQHAEGPDSTGPWSLTKSVKFGEPSAGPEEHNEALAATSNTAQSPADFNQTNPSPEASPRRPGQCIWVLDDPIVRGKRFRLQCKAPKENNDLHLLFVRTEKKRLSVVALDVALAKEKGLEAAKLVYNKRLAKPFLCSRAVRLDFSYRKQDCSMAVTPSGEGQVALCLVKESDTLGSAMWTLLDFVVVQVCQTSPQVPQDPQDPVQKSKEEMLAEAGEKLREDLGRLVNSLTVAAFSGAREVAQSLIHKESSADNRSMLRRISQARSVESVIECGKVLDRAQKGFQDLKNTIRNLCSILAITWDSREKLPWSFYQIENDRNIIPKIDVRARSQMTMSNLSVHDMGGVTISNFRVLLSWYGDDGRSDLDLYLSCPECGGVVHHQNKRCNCVEQLQLTLGLEALPESDQEIQEALGVDLAADADAGVHGVRCIRSITKDGPLDQACARDNIQLQPGDVLLGPLDVENQTLRIQKSRPGRVELDVDHLGPKHMRSEQNVFVNSQPSDKTYVFKVHLFAGDPVEYQVLVQRVGFPDIVYNLPAHQETDQTVEVFSMTALQLESAWQPLELD